MRWEAAILPAALLAAAVRLDAGAGPAPEGPSFNRDVRPILAARCFACHGPDAGARQAKLRLDTREGALADRGGYAAVVPGDREASELAYRVTAGDALERMPPAEAGEALSAREVDVLLRWIDAGAEWEPHWSYVAPRASELPAVSHPEWVLDAVDAYVLARLDAEGLAPSPEADRRTLARRLHFDLVGLPASPEDVDAFVSDPDPRAYEKLVERLLASPHHAERLAQHWLDLVRYADTNGYHGDQERSVWPFRDWVIDAFARNVPFDEFTVEQLAGDLLPEATRAQLVASGYSRLGMSSSEGGGQDAEYLTKYASERVRATSTVWLGATLGCAECHDHKFDPYTSADFYSFAAFFADLAEKGIELPAHQKVPTAEQEAALAALDGRIAGIRRELDTPTPELAAAQAAWEREARAALGDGRRADFDWIDDEQANGGKTEGGWQFFGPDAGPVLSGRSSRVQAGVGVRQHFFHGATRTVTVGEADRFFAYVFVDPDDPPRTVMLQLHAADGWGHRAFWGEDHIGFGAIGSDAPDHRPMGPLPESGQWVRLEVDPARVGLAPGTVVDGMAFTQYEGRAHWDRAGLFTADPRLLLGGVSDEVADALRASAGELSLEHAAALAAHYRTIAPELADTRARLAAAKAERAALEKTFPEMLVAVTTTPRTVRVLPRGNWMDDSGPEVLPAVPSVLGELALAGDGPAGEARRATRLDLARWLVSPDNPLTARVFVNRLWALLHGRGLCASVGDLGSQGEWPSHPELLDRLALDFVESGWDVRALVRRLVTTRTYRQSSEWRPELARRDPANRLFARQGRWRLEAELVRDVVLEAAGLLDLRVGGPSVKPYQPAGHWAQLNFPEREWQAGTGSELYRRGLYTFWCRTFLHPSLAAFDAPTREECTVARDHSNTPQQALVLLNNPSYVEAARALARRALAAVASKGADPDRIGWLWRRALAREPRAAERALVSGLLARHRAQYVADPAAARALLGVGELALPELVDAEAAELAAWTSVARVVLNLSETITRS